MFDVWNMVHAHVFHYLVSYGGNILCTVDGLARPAHHKEGGDNPEHTGHQCHQTHPARACSSGVGTEMASSPGAPLTHHGIPRVTKSPRTPYQCLQPVTLQHTYPTLKSVHLHLKPLSPPSGSPLAVSTCRSRFLNNFRDSEGRGAPGAEAGSRCGPQRGQKPLQLARP